MFVTNLMLCTFIYCDFFVFVIIVDEFLFKLLFPWMLLYIVLHVSASWVIQINIIIIIIIILK